MQNLTAYLHVSECLQEVKSVPEQVECYSVFWGDQ